MPLDITRLTEGWLELESDPGLFMLLLDDFGVKNVQVEEIYDITKPFDGPVYGFIFLFRWIEERRSRRKIFDQNDMFLKEEGVVNNIFFAQQMVPNSCATHALLSVLLNCPKISLGDTLARLKADTVGMTPENKGWAIGNTPELARAHNSHAMPQAKRCVEKNSASASVTSGRYAGEAFHFVSYVPIHDRLFELDGLKPYPIDHGPCVNDEDWTEKFRKVMTERLGVAGDEPCHDIRFNLMALIPDRRIALSHKLNMLKTNQEIVVTALQQLVHINNESKKCNFKDEEKDTKEASDLCSNSSLTESEAALINDLKLEKVERYEELEDKSERNTYKPEPVINYDENNTNQTRITDEMSFSSNEIDSLSDVKNDIASSSKENIAPYQLENKGSLCVNSSDYSTPLSIKTSPNPSLCSTETSSEIGSAFNSPLALGWSWNSCQNSPCSKEFKKYVVLHVEDEKSESPPSCALGLMPVKRISHQSQSNGIKIEDFKSEKSPNSIPSDTPSEKSVNSKEDPDAKTTLMLKYPVLREPHTFAPKDLLALLKNVESEIANCETSLKDENDKRSKYKIDDCRRTQNYDEFLCTFFTMMANQSKLADLVEQEVHKRPGMPAHRLKKILVVKKSDNKTIAKRRKGKAKHRRRH